jgi:hypothetical protein
MHVNDECTMDQYAINTYIAPPIPPRYLAPSKGPRLGFVGTSVAILQLSVGTEDKG